MPTSTVCCGSTAGRRRRSARARPARGPSSAASGMPCTLPDSLGRRAVHVAVRVDPDQPERLAALAPDIRGRRRHRAGAEAVIAAEHDRQRAFVERRQRRSETASGRRARSPSHSACADRRRPCVSGIGEAMSPLSTTRTPSAVELLAEAGNAKRRRPHVGAAAVAAEIERNADDVNGPHRISVSCRSSRCPRSPARRWSLSAMRVGFDRARKSIISFFLLMTLCARKRPPGVTRGKTMVEELLVVGLPRVEEHEVERARRAWESPRTHRRESPGRCRRGRRRLMFSAASLARTGSNSMVVSLPPVSRRPMPDPDAAVSAGPANFQDAPGLGGSDQHAQEPAVLFGNRQLSLVGGANSGEDVPNGR